MKRLLPILALSLGLAACGGTTSPTGPSGTAPRVTSIAPASGTTLGGTTVTITGANFSAGATVTIGGTAATGVTVAGASTITAVTPQHAVGAADVVVSVGGQSATLPGAFTFVAPAPITNTPPVITGITAQGTKTSEPAQFADLGETIAVTATVTDAETPVANLTYQWSAPLGTFSGTGASVTWTAPAAMTTPASVTLSLVVIENYTTTDPNGLPIQQQNKVTGGVAVSVHDSAKEVGDMAVNFLVNFSKQVAVATVLQDFRDGCGLNDKGKHYETEDVTDNQVNWDIYKYTVGQPRATVRFGGQCTLFADRYRTGDACILVDTQWWSTRLTAPTNSNDPPIGSNQYTWGTDQVSAVYGPQNRWWLCDSDFLGQSQNLLTGKLSPSSIFKK